MTDTVPTHLPPAETARLPLKAELVALTATELKQLPVAAAGVMTPVQAVEGVAKQATAAKATTWQSGKTIVNQWTINQDRNSWIGVAGIGWQKLSTASDSGCVALTMLSSNALISKASVSYRQEADGMVHEIYVF